MSELPNKRISEDLLFSVKKTKQPKKPQKAWNIYSNEEMAKDRERRGNLPFKDLMPEISTRWRNLSPDKKDYYEQLALKDKDRYKKEISALGLPVEHETTWDGKKKPRNAYTFYQAHMMKKLREKTTDKFDITEASSIIGAKWKNETKKKKWEALYKVECDKFDAYLNSLPQYKRDIYENTIREKKMKALKKGPKTPYQHWQRKNSGYLREFTKTEQFMKWRGLSLEEKKYWNQEFIKISDTVSTFEKHYIWQFQKRDIWWIDFAREVSDDLTDAYDVFQSQIKENSNLTSQETVSQVKVRFHENTYIIDFATLTVFKKDKPLKRYPLRKVITA